MILDDDKPFAFLIGGDTVHYCSVDLMEETPHSPAVDLIQGIYDLFGLKARSLLRNRIFLSYEPTPMCREMIKVAAKRATVLSNPSKTFNELSLLKWNKISAKSDVKIPIFFLPPHIDPRQMEHEDFLALGEIMAKRIPITLPRHRSDRPIGSLLVDSENKILDWSVNSNHVNKTLHAEVNLLQGYFSKYKKPLPQGVRLYSSLKPCRMCAAMISYCSPKHNPIRVFYRHDDPGRWARGTSLDKAGQLHHLPGVTL